MNKSSQSASSNAFHPTVATYRALIEGLRATAVREFPERAQDVYIVDDTQPPEQEIAKAAKFLNIPDLDTQLHSEANYPRVSGLGITFHLSEGRNPSIVFGWGYALSMDKTNINKTIDPATFSAMAKAQIHEFVHGLDGRGGTKYDESLAELIAVDVMMRNGLMSQKDVEKIMQDYTKAQQENPDNMYQPQEGYALLIKRFYAHPAEYNPANFRGFTNLRDSYDRVGQIMFEVSNSQFERARSKGLTTCITLDHDHGTLTPCETPKKKSAPVGSKAPLIPRH